MTKKIANTQRSFNAKNKFVLNFATPDEKQGYKYTLFAIIALYEMGEIEGGKAELIRRYDAAADLTINDITERRHDSLKTAVRACMNVVK